MLMINKKTVFTGESLIIKNPDDETSIYVEGDFWNFSQKYYNNKHFLIVECYFENKRVFSKSFRISDKKAKKLTIEACEKFDNVFDLMHHDELPITLIKSRKKQVFEMDLSEKKIKEIR